MWACLGIVAVVGIACDAGLERPLTTDEPAGVYPSPGGPASTVTSQPDSGAPDDAATPSPPADAAPPSTRADPGFPLTMPCTDVTPETTVVTTTEASGPAPQGQGGTLEDGIYDLVSMAYYNAAGATDTPDRETIRISGGGTRLEYISGQYGFSIALAIAPANGVLNDTEVCPADKSYLNMFVGPEYTATPGQFVTGNGKSYLKVFSKRP